MEHLQYQIYEKPYGFVRIKKSTLGNIHKIENMILEIQKIYILILKSQKKLSSTRYDVKNFMETLKRYTL